MPDLCCAQHTNETELHPPYTAKIVAVDYVQTVVERMRLKYPRNKTGVVWAVGDLTDWESFAPELQGHQPQLLRACVLCIVSDRI